jgi:DNA invertase Pin-like site-specific DNA recombinase
VIAYYRVSTDKQGRSGLGLESQRAIVRQFHRDDLVGEYTEIGSGSSVAGRPVLQQAIAEANRLGVPLVVAKVDRLARNTREALELFDALDGRLVCCDVPNADRFTLTLFFAFAERERELVSIRTKLALERKRERDGEWRVSHLTAEGRAKGAKVVRDRARSNPSNRRAMAYAAEILRDNTLTAAALADRLNSAGFRTSTGGKFSRMAAWRVAKQVG